MKENRGYITKVLLLQMIIIPIVLTFGMIIFSSLVQQSLNLDLGKQAGNLIILIISVIISWIVGALIGMLFSKNSSSEIPQKTKYLTPVFPIIYALCFAIMALALSNGNYNSGWWGIYAIKNPFFIVFNFFVAFTGYGHIMYIVEVMAYTGFLFGVFLFDIIFRRAGMNIHKGIKRTVLAALVIVIVFIGIGSRDIINNGMIEIVYGRATLGSDLTEYDLMGIAPFKDGNGLATLNRSASLQFDEFEDMPRLDGATAAYPVYASFAQAVYVGLGEYYNENKNDYSKDVYSAFVTSDYYPYNIIKCTKTGAAYERLINRETDIIFVAEPSKAHVEAVKAKGDDFVLTQIGSEAFVFFTNIKNPVDNLTIEEIQGIYSGGITNWKEVGGRNKGILPYQRPQNSGSQTVMENRVMRGTEMLPPTKETYAGGMGEIISNVASYKNARNAIGYSFLYYSSHMVANNQIKYIAVDGIKPTKENIVNKTYPFTVPVYAVTLKSNNNENVQKFIEWIQSEEAQELVEKTGYINTLK